MSLLITVEQLLSIKSLEGIKLIAGHAGIHNRISLANIIENPDAFDWLSPNELILSTGYVFKDSEEMQIRIIQELSEINCAGLMIKMRRYFDKLPQNMIELADRLGFPLLELPFEYTLAQVIAIVNEKTSADYDTLNRRSLDLHHDLFKIALEGGGVEQIADKLSATIDNPLIIVDRDWNLLCHKESMSAVVPLERIVPLEMGKPVLPIDFTDKIPKYMSEIKRSIKRIYHHGGQAYICRIMPVAVSNFVYGYIVVFQTGRSLTEFDYLAMENVSTILTLDRIKAKEIEEAKLKIRQDLFDILLSGNAMSPDMLKTLSEAHGLQEKHAYYCVLIQIESRDPDSYPSMVHRKYELEHVAKKCAQLIHGLSNRSNGEVVSYFRNQEIVVLVGKQEHKSPVIKQEAKALAEEMLEELNGQAKEMTFHLAIGGQYPTLHSLHRSFHEAQEALRLLQRLGDDRAIVHFEDLAGDHFLDSNIKPSEMESFVHKSLGAVSDHDRAFGTSFVATLDYYFKYNRNVTEAAKAMFIHRNTFIYRIDKIKELLHTDLKDTDELFQLQLALKLFRLMRAL
ncbi:PucR family transcriptional regulator [Cohnella soli]|uniref:PucR family transcriptional regulator n=1 Tax=Cohnella soli TaxID=425005 RepID=A0ABW0HNK5_9BACL